MPINVRADRRPHAGAARRPGRRRPPPVAGGARTDEGPRPRGDGGRRDRRLDGADLSAGRVRQRRRRSASWPRSPASTAAATTRTCATKATGCWRRSTRPWPSAGPPARRCISSISRRPAGRTGARCSWPSPGSTPRAPQASKWPPTCIPTSTTAWASRPSFIRGTSADGPAALVAEPRRSESLRAEIRREMETDFGYENWYRHVGFDWDRVVLGGMPRRAVRRAQRQVAGRDRRGAGEGPVGRVLRRRARRTPSPCRRP